MGRSWAPRNTSHGSVILKNFYSSHLLCICPSLLETNLNKAKYSFFEKPSEFLALQVPVLKRNKATNSSTSNHPFFSCNQNPHGNLFTLLRLTITFARAVCRWG